MRTEIKNSGQKAFTFFVVKKNTEILCSFSIYFIYLLLVRQSGIIGLHFIGSELRLFHTIGNSGRFRLHGPFSMAIAYMRFPRVLCLLDTYRWKIMILINFTNDN